MVLYVLFENKNTFLFLYFICLLLNLQMCQIILTDPVQRNLTKIGQLLTSAKSNHKIGYQIKENSKNFLFFLVFLKIFV